jgi:crotonobetainyl-CoA:carnitine CoA-transferase CaiB-like acyl-CoA transferase
MSHEFPFRGLKVLDLGQGVASPYCGMLLALYGADVVKIEPPEGDWARNLGGKYDGGRQSAMSLTFNRGKRSLMLDLKLPAARAVLRRMAEQADVLIEGFRPGVAARLGVGYDSLKAVNPKLIMVSISGFGQTGPYSQRPVTDTAAQAFSGFVNANRGPDNVPHRAPILICDVSTGLYAYQSVATALYARRDAGVGRWIDISLMGSAAAFMGHRSPEAMLETGPLVSPNVPAGGYQTADGWVAVALVTEAQFIRWCDTMRRPDLPIDPRFNGFPARAANEAALVEIIVAIMLTETNAIWIDRLRAADVICDPVTSMRDWYADPHVLATGAASVLDQPGLGAFHVPRTPGAMAETEAALSPAPRNGQHNSAILSDADLATLSGDAA